MTVHQQQKIHHLGHAYFKWGCQSPWPDAGRMHTFSVSNY